MINRKKGMLYFIYVEDLSYFEDSRFLRYFWLHFTLKRHNTNFRIVFVSVFDK